MDTLVFDILILCLKVIARQTLIHFNQKTLQTLTKYFEQLFLFETNIRRIDTHTKRKISMYPQ